MPIFGKKKKKKDGAKAEAKAKLQIQRLQNEASAEQRLAEEELKRIRTFQKSGNKKAAMSAAKRYREHMNTMNSLLNQANTIRKGIKAKRTADRSSEVVTSLSDLNVATKDSLKKAGVSQTTSAISELATNVEKTDMVQEILEGDVLEDYPTEEEETELEDIISMAMGEEEVTAEAEAKTPALERELDESINLPKIPQDTEITEKEAEVDEDERKRLLKKLAKRKEELKGE